MKNKIIKAKNYTIFAEVKIVETNKEYLDGSIPIKFSFSETVPKDFSPIGHLRKRLSEEIKRADINNGDLIIWEDQEEGEVL